MLAFISSSYFVLLNIIIISHITSHYLNYLNTE